MYAAQEMFKTANKVTRPEKALILGFMAGSRGTAGQSPFHQHTCLIKISIAFAERYLVDSGKKQTKTDADSF